MRARDVHALIIFCNHVPSCIEVNVLWLMTATTLRVFCVRNTRHTDPHAGTQMHEALLGMENLRLSLWR